jgi:hypothetical protein
MTDRGHEIGVVPSGALDFAAQGRAIGMGAVDVECELAQDGEVFGSIVLSGTVRILGEVDVERPMEPVLDAPVTACDLQNDPKSKTTFNFRVDRWDSAGESIFDHVGGSDDFLCAVKLYEAARRRWPGERVTLRQGARTVHKSWRDDA